MAPVRRRSAISRRRRVPFPDIPGASLQSRLDAIESWSPDIGLWVRAALDPRGARDRAVRSAAALLAQPSRSAAAKELEAQLGRYLANVWPRDRQKPAPPASASPLRRELWRIAYLTDGEGLRFRTIFDLIELPQE